MHPFGHILKKFTKLFRRGKKIVGCMSVYVNEVVFCCIWIFFVHELLLFGLTAHFSGDHELLLKLANQSLWRLVALHSSF